MTDNANALPIQERLRSQEPMTRTEAADRIDALEKALLDATAHLAGAASAYRTYACRRHAVAQRRVNVQPPRLGDP